MFGSRQSLGNSSPWISLADAGKALWTLNCMKSDREIWIGRRFSLWLVWLLVVLVFACLVMSGIDVPPGAKRQAHSGQQKPNEKIPCVPRSPKPGACRGRRRADSGTEPRSGEQWGAARARSGACENAVACARASDPDVNGD